MAKKKSKEEKYIDLDKIIEEKTEQLMFKLNVMTFKDKKRKLIKSTLTEILEMTEENNRRRNRNMVRYLNE